MSFYPINPDTAVESFLLISSDVQKTNLGPTYNLSQLVPLNYRKVMDAIIDPNIGLASVPLREFYYIFQDPKKPGEISEEFSNGLQSGTLMEAFSQIFNYYNVISQISAFSIAAGVVTEIKTDLIANTNPSAQDTFWITHKLKVEWFVVPGSQFS